PLARSVPAAAQPAPKITPEQFLREAYGRKEYDKVLKVAYALLWTDIRRSDVLYWLARSLESLDRTEEAYTWCRLLHRVLDEQAAAGSPPQAAAILRRWCD